MKVELFHRKLLEAHLCIQGCKTFYETLEEMQ